MTNSEASSAISVEHLVKVFDVGFGRKRPFTAANDVTFSVRHNSVFGFLGPNGAGKTTTIKVLTGLIFATSGTVRVFGGSPNATSVRARFGFLPENPSFPDHLTGVEVLRFASQLLNLPHQRIPAEVDRALALVDLKRASGVQVRKYSKGMVQRLGIAQALLGNPELVILDEPMSGLDPIGRREVKDLISGLRREGKTVFFSTHIIADVEETCDDVGIIVNAKMTRWGRVGEFLGAGTREMEVTARNLPDDFQGRKPGEGGVSALVAKDQTELRALLERIWSVGGQVVGVYAKKYGLEDVFLEEVRKEPNRAPVGEP